jgi:two-component system phosphate regulon sensor histidine kinase PhoR
MPETLPEKAVPAAVVFFVALALLPAVMFGLLSGLGDLTPGHALLAWGIYGVVAALFGMALGRDLVVMTRLLRALRTSPDVLPSVSGLFVPGMRTLGEEAVRLVQAERLGRARGQAQAVEDRALVERLPDPLLKLDGAGNMLWRNDSAVSAFGNETAALLRHPDMRLAFAEAVAAGLPVRREMVLTAPMARDLEVTMIPVGGPVYMLVNDRTRERALEKTRADFVANSSHELRTPLASLIGFIETLRGPAADDVEVQQRFLGIMAEQAGRMQRVIADLLSLSRIEISEHSPPKEILLLPPVFERIAAGMEPMLKDAAVTLRMDVPVNLPRIPADADQLAQLFTNLLDNALKYGKRGGEIKLTASAAPDLRFEPGGVVISVADDGAGIPREHIPRLTERFYRVDKGRSRAVGGTGLGLAIVKHVVNRHRGRLVVDSEMGKGTIFTIWLPGVAK